MTHTAPGENPKTPLQETAGQAQLDPVMVTMTFHTNKPTELLAVLAKYIVIARMDPLARNIDLVASVTKPGRLTVIEKWNSAVAQQAHFNGATMVEMATACEGLLTTPPDIDLHEPVSMHDLR